MKTLADVTAKIDRLARSLNAKSLAKAPRTKYAPVIVARCACGAVWTRDDINKRRRCPLACAVPGVGDNMQRSSSPARSEERKL